MDKEILTFGDIQVEKHKSYQYKSPISINGVDISKIIVSNRVSLVKKVLNILLGMKKVKKLDLFA